MPKISIIVPIYNVEPYLRKCIESILKQTFTDFELILINDGSTDNSPIICNEYAATDNRVVVIHKKNAGVSAARNAGLEIAKGEWVGFMDSDDWCDPEMYKFLFNNAIQHGVDISVCDYSRYYKDENILYSDKNEHPGETIESNDAILKIILKETTVGLPTILVKKELFSYNSGMFRFDEKISFSEDRLLYYCLLKKSKKIYFSEKALYYYRCRTDSVTSTRKNIGITPQFITLFDAYEKMIKMENDIKIKTNFYIEW